MEVLGTIKAIEQSKTFGTFTKRSVIVTIRGTISANDISYSSLYKTNAVYWISSKLVKVLKANKGINLR